MRASMPGPDQRDRRTRAQDHRPARADRCGARRQSECRRGRRRPVGQHHGRHCRRARRSPLPRAGRRARMMAAIEAIVATLWTAGTRARLEVIGGFLPMDADCRRRPRSSISIGPRPAMSASMSAARRRAAAPIPALPRPWGAATLCGIGPVGGGAHSPARICRLDSLSAAGTGHWRSPSCGSPGDGRRPDDAFAPARRRRSDPVPRRQSAAPQRNSS